MAGEGAAATWTDAQLDAHAALLAKRVFQVDTKWPHFRLLLRNIREWAKKIPPGAVVISFERTLLYGGNSLIAPFFREQRFISVDGGSPSADERGAYNKSMVEDSRFIAVPLTGRAPDEGTGLDSDIADLVLIPNLAHHVANQSRLFKQIARVVKPGGRVYVFEPLVRELHQIPNDYLRYTPFGRQELLREVELAPESYELEAGPFSAIAYCWTQALEYFPETEREEMERWFYQEHFRQLMEWDNLYRINRIRKYTEFPMSFSVVAAKPAAT